MTPIQRAHPFTSGAVALALAAMALVLPSPPQLTALYLSTVAVACASGAARSARTALIAVTPIWLLLFLLQGVYGEGARVSAPWGGTLSEHGLLWAWSQGARLAVIATASLSFAASFDPHRFLQAAIAARWPFGAAFLLVATLDSAEQLGEQARRLREAQRTRGVHVSGSIRARVRAFPALVLPLLLVSLTEADDRALALETRGLMIRGPRVATDPPHDSAADRAVRWFAVLAVIGAIVWRIRR